MLFFYQKFRILLSVVLLVVLMSGVLIPVDIWADSVQINLEVGSGGGGGGGGPDPEDPPPPVSGCTDPTASNYNSGATVDDGSCSYSGTEGCTNPVATNYDPDATVDDGSCVYEETVPNVSNFQASLVSTNGEIRLSWTNPVFADLAAVRIVRKIGSVPVDETDGSLIYDGGGQSAVDGGVTVIGTYYYAAFVRSTSGDYSSGTITSENVSEDDDNIPNPNDPEDGGGDRPDPFDDLPEATSSDPKVARLSLGDFIFYQAGEPIQLFGRGTKINLKGNKNFTVSLPYEKVPEVLKTIGVTIYHPTDPNQVFSFLLKLNKARTAYEATIGNLPVDGIYPVNIYIINFEDQTVKRINGSIEVVGVGFLPSSTVTRVAERVVAPVAVGAGVAVGVTQAVLLSSGASSLFDVYLLLLKGIGALLGFLGIRRKHKPWGTVYDAITKRPIDPAYVSVEALDHQGGEVASAITDIDGRYGFFLAPGTYRIKAGKTHYAFPSQHLSGKEADELYGNLYFGEPVQTSGEEVINKNIPLDPVGFDWNEFTKSKSDYFKVFSKKEVKRARIFNTIYGIGFGVALVSMLVTPGLLNLAMLALYAGLFIFQAVWKRRHKIVQIKRENNDEPVPFAIVRFYLADLDQEVKHVVADALGRFYVLLRPDTYYFTVEEKQADGSYRKVYKSDPIQLKKGILNQDIVIRSVESNAIDSTEPPAGSQPIEVPEAKEANVDQPEFGRRWDEKRA